MAESELNVSYVDRTVLLLVVAVAVQAPWIRLEQLALARRLVALVAPHLAQLAHLAVADRSLGTAQLTGVQRFGQATVGQQVFELIAQLGDLVEALLFETAPAAPLLRVRRVLVPIEFGLFQFKPLFVGVQNGDRVAVIGLEILARFLLEKTDSMSLWGWS